MNFIHSVRSMCNKAWPNKRWALSTLAKGLGAEAHYDMKVLYDHFLLGYKLFSSCDPLHNEQPEWAYLLMGSTAHCCSERPNSTAVVTGHAGACLCHKKACVMHMQRHLEAPHQAVEVAAEVTVAVMSVLWQCHKAIS